MNPFDVPPNTPPVSVEPPDPPAPRRGRMALVALASAGLLAGGIVGISAFASADDPVLESSELAAAAAAADTGDDGDDAGDDGTGDDTGDSDGGELPFDLDGEIVIDFGEGDPIVIDVGEMIDLDDAQLAQLEECIGLPEFAAGGMEFGEFALPFDLSEIDDAELEEMFSEFEAMLDDIDLGELGDFDFGEFGEFGDGEFFDVGDSVTVMGPDGLSVIDLGDGDASVTITRDGDTGDITVTTDGTATEQSIGELFGDFALPFELGEFELGEFDPDEFDGMFGELDVWGGPILDVDPQAINDCLADFG